MEAADEVLSVISNVYDSVSTMKKNRQLADKILDRLDALKAPLKKIKESSDLAEKNMKTLSRLLKSMNKLYTFVNKRLKKKWRKLFKAKALEKDLNVLIRELNTCIGDLILELQTNTNKKVNEVHNITMENGMSLQRIENNIMTMLANQQETKLISKKLDQLMNQSSTSSSESYVSDSDIDMLESSEVSEIEENVDEIFDNKRFEKKKTQKKIDLKSLKSTENLNKTTSKKDLSDEKKTLNKTTTSNKTKKKKKKKKKKKYKKKKKLKTIFNPNEIEIEYFQEKYGIDERSAEILHRTFDTDRDKKVSLFDIQNGLQILKNGSLIKKAEFGFKSWDLDGNGALSQDEVYDVIRDTFVLVNCVILSQMYGNGNLFEHIKEFDEKARQEWDNNFDSLIRKNMREINADKVVKEMFNNTKTNQNGEIEKDQFIEYCKLPNSIANKFFDALGEVIGEVFEIKSLKNDQQFKRHQTRRQLPKIPKNLNLKYIALYDYTGEEKNDLIFSQGDIIQVIEKDKNGWWVGKCKEKVGSFPSNFVKLYTNENQINIEKETNTFEKKNNLNDNETSENEKNIQQYRTLVDYLDSDERETQSKENYLKYVKGNILNFVSFSSNKDYIKLKDVTGRVGLVLKDNISPFRKRKKLKRYKVLYSYQRTDGENYKYLNLNVGEHFEVIKERKDGWLEGISQEGKRGLFPTNYAQILKNISKQFCFAIKDFNAYKDLEDKNIKSYDQFLPLLKGEEYEILQMNLKDYYKGKDLKTNREGLFPKNGFVELISEDGQILQKHTNLVDYLKHSETLAPKTANQNLVLSNNNRTVKSVRESHFKAIRGKTVWSSGKHYFQIRIDSVYSNGQNSSMIGVVVPNTTGIGYLNAQGWSFYCFNGTKWNAGKSQKYGTKVKQNDIVGMILDMDKRTLSYDINGEDLGVAFENLPDELVLCFDLYYPDEQLTLVDGLAKKSKLISLSTESLNPESLEGTLDFSCENRTIESTGLNSWKTVKGTQVLTSGKYYFQIRIDSTNSNGYSSAMIGVMAPKTSGIGFKNAQGWSFYCFDGTKWNGGENEEYGTKVKQNDLVGMVVDMDKRTLSYDINGEDFGVTFDNLPDELILNFDIFFANEMITLYDFTDYKLVAIEEYRKISFKNTFQNNEIKFKNSYKTIKNKINQISSTRMNISLKNGKHYFKFKIDNFGSSQKISVVIGVISANYEGTASKIDQKDQESVCNWGFCCHNGNKLYRNNLLEYGNRVKQDDIVGMIVDMDNHTLTFEVNGEESFGNAFANLPDELDVFVDLYFANLKVSLIEYLDINYYENAKESFDTNYSTYDNLIEFTNDNKTVTSLELTNPQTIRGNIIVSSGINVWKIRIDNELKNPKSLRGMIGVIAPQVNDLMIQSDLGYAFSVAMGNTIHETKKKNYARALKQNDILSVIVDMNKHTLSYKINEDEELGIAYKNIPNKVKLSIDLIAPGEKYTLIDYQKVIHYPRYEDSLNPKSIFGKLKVTNDNKSVKNIGEEEFVSIKGTQILKKGKYIYKIRIDSVNSDGFNSSMIGVVKPETKGVGYQGINGWSFYCFNGTKWNGNKNQEYGTKVNENDIVTMTVDMDNHTLSYKLNETDFGIAFENLPNELKLCLDLFYKKEKLTITEFKKIKPKISFSDKFDPDSLNDFLQLSNQNKTITSFDKDQFKSIKGTNILKNGKYIYKFQIDSINSNGNNSTMIGVVAPETTGIGYINAQGWSFYCFNGTKWNGAKNQKYGTKATQNDIVTMTVDMDKHTLSYKLNENDFGIAFENLPNELKLNLDLYYINEKITLIDSKNIIKQLKYSLDPNSIFGTLELTNGNKTIKNLEKDIFKSIKGNTVLKQGKHIFKIQIDSIHSNGFNSSMIGVVTPETTGVGYMNENGWSFYCFNGTKWNAGKNQEYGTKGKQNDIVTMTVDMDKHTLSYKLNENDFGIAFENLPNELKLCLDLFYTNEQLTLIDYQTENIKIIEKEKQTKNESHENKTIEIENKIENKQIEKEKTKIENKTKTETNEKQIEKGEIEIKSTEIKKIKQNDPNTNEKTLDKLDVQSKFGTLQLTNDNKTIKSLQQDKFKSIKGNKILKKGKHIYKIQIDSIHSNGFNSTMIGVVAPEITGIGYMNKQGWSFYCFNGHKWNENKHQVYGTKVKKNDIITMTVDMDKHTLSYKLNEKDFGIAFENLPNELKLCLDLFYKNEQLTLIDHQIENSNQENIEIKTDIEIKVKTIEIEEPEQIENNTNEKPIDKLNPQTKFGTLELTNENKTIKSLEKDIFKSIKGTNILTKGKHIYKIQIDTIHSNGFNSSMIGVVTPGTTGIGYINAQGWSFYCFNGTKWNATKHQEYGTKVKQNDIVTMTVDMDKHTLSYKLNENDFGIAFENLPNELKLCLDLFYTNEQLTLIDYQIENDDQEKIITNENLNIKTKITKIEKPKQIEINTNEKPIDKLDPQSKFGTLELTNDNKTIKSLEQNKFKSIKGTNILTKGKHIYKIQIESIHQNGFNSTMIGVVAPETTGIGYMNAQGWSMYCFNGHKWNANKNQVYGTKVKKK
ncbi:spry domain containing socs box protein [Anaeramoeba flamelloides]|uniref:Spry domain containing socs box protein n=1 Tax=Anaeramoeba flamelloides TaxID=1746091 RepID=A0AAV7YAN7_9EUKA|nr:spry domain containing socs box protein [Anaeramoeba flamelloides]